MSEELEDLKVELSEELRRPPLQEDERELEQLIVTEHHERAQRALRRWTTTQDGPRAYELLVSWQALARLAHDAPEPEQTRSLLEALQARVHEAGPQLVTLATQRMDLTSWREALKAYVSDVLVPARWSDATSSASSSSSSASTTRCSSRPPPRRLTWSWTRR